MEAGGEKGGGGWVLNLIASNVKGMISWHAFPFNKVFLKCDLVLVNITPGPAHLSFKIILYNNLANSLLCSILFFSKNKWSTLWTLSFHCFFQEIRPYVFLARNHCPWVLFHNRWAASKLPVKCRKGPDIYKDGEAIWWELRCKCNVCSCESVQYIALSCWVSELCDLHWWAAGAGTIFTGAHLQ